MHVLACVLTYTSSCWLLKQHGLFVVVLVASMFHCPRCQHCPMRTSNVCAHCLPATVATRPLCVQGGLPEVWVQVQMDFDRPDQEPTLASDAFSSFRTAAEVMESSQQVHMRLCHLQALSTVLVGYVVSVDWFKLNFPLAYVAAATLYNNRYCASVLTSYMCDTHCAVALLFSKLHL